MPTHGLLEYSKPTQAKCKEHPQRSVRIHESFTKYFQKSNGFIKPHYKSS